MELWYFNAHNEEPKRSVLTEQQVVEDIERSKALHSFSIYFFQEKQP